MNKAIVTKCKKYYKDVTQQYIGEVVDILAVGHGSYICQCKNTILTFSEDELERLIMFGPILRQDSKLTIREIIQVQASRESIWLAYTDTRIKHCYKSIVTEASLGAPNFLYVTCEVTEGRAVRANVPFRISTDDHERNDNHYSIYWEAPDEHAIQ